MEDAPALAGPLVIHRTASCTITLDAARRATDQEIVALLFPKLSLDTLELPKNALPGGGFGVELCNGSVVDAMHLTRQLGMLTRIEYGTEREVVQVSFGSRAGMVESVAGVMALIERSGATVSATAFRDASGGEVDEHDVSPHELAPIRKASFGGIDALFIESPDVTWGEGPDAGAIVTILFVRPATLAHAGMAFVSHRSNRVFWHGPFRWSMKSDGLKSDGVGYTVREHWTFTNRRTKAQSSREVARTYRALGDKIVATPSEDLSVWPETRGDWDADTPGDDDPE